RLQTPCMRRWCSDSRPMARRCRRRRAGISPPLWRMRRCRSGSRPRCTSNGKSRRARSAETAGSRDRKRVTYALRRRRHTWLRTGLKCSFTSELAMLARLFAAAALLGIVAPAVTHAASGSPGDTPPLTVEDLVRLKRLSDPQVSPDGRYVAFVLRETDIDANRGRTDIWLLDLRARDGQPRRLTQNPANDSSP